MNKMFATSDLTGGNDVLFRKTLKHAHQHEYRILWHSDLKDIPDFIDIVVPEARQFCREIKEGELI